MFEKMRLPKTESLDLRGGVEFKEQERREEAEFIDLAKNFFDVQRDITAGSITLKNHEDEVIAQALALICISVMPAYLHNTKMTNEETKRKIEMMKEAQGILNHFKQSSE